MVFSFSVEVILETRIEIMEWWNTEMMG